MLEASINPKYLCSSSNARYLIAFPFVNSSTSSHIIWPLLIATLAYFSRPNFFSRLLTMDFVQNSSEWNHCLHKDNLRGWISMEHIWFHFYFYIVFLFCFFWWNCWHFQGSSQNLLIPPKLQVFWKLAISETNSLAVKFFSLNCYFVSTFVVASEVLPVPFVLLGK